MENRVPTVLTYDNQFRAVCSSLAPANFGLSLPSKSASGKLGRLHLLTGHLDVPETIHMVDIITSLELSDFDGCPLLLRSLVQASSDNNGTPFSSPAKVIQQPLRRAQLACNCRSNATRHPLVSVTRHCQTLGDDLVARPLTAVLFIATFF